MVSKPKVVRQIIAELIRSLDNLAAASRSMHADASDDSNKAEDKYDTRSLETAYLASSQARQATETEEALAQYQVLPSIKFTAKTPIAVGALIELESRGETFLYFLGPKAGGTEIKVAGKEILVITSESPLGQALLGRKTGDQIQLHGQKFQIVAVR
jgi:transcription elongation GreA/GreB family factor